MTEQAPDVTEPVTFTTIGVVGLGTMGAGIAEVFARNGFSVIGVELNDEGIARGRQHLENSTARAVKREKLTEAEQADLLGRISLLHDDEGPARRRLRRRGGRRVAGDQEGRSSSELEGIVAPDAILATNTSSLSVTEISTANAHPGRVIGVHFFNPAPVQNLVEIIRTVVTEPNVLEDVKTLVRAARQDPGGLRRQGRLHRQHAAVRLPQPRGGDVRGQVRLPRGHRRRHAVRLRLPDGSAPAAGPDRPRHGLRDPRDDVSPGPRPPARARRRSSSRWSPRGCSAARPAAASTPTTARTARSR